MLTATGVLPNAFAGPSPAVLLPEAREVKKACADTIMCCCEQQ
jgi:hypothetical protein